MGSVAAQNGTAPVSTPAKFVPGRLRALRHPIDLVGRLLIVHQLESSLRFKSSERFGYEIPHRREFFRHAFHYLRFNGIDGDYAEFGSHGAFTFRLAWGASELLGQPCHLWAFDSFEGLPGADDARGRPSPVAGRHHGDRVARVPPAVPQGRDPAGPLFRRAGLLLLDARPRGGGSPPGPGELRVRGL